MDSQAMRDDATILFHEFDLDAAMRSAPGNISASVEQISDRDLLNQSVDELCDSLAEEFQINVPVLLEDNITVEQEDTKIDVSRDQNRYISDRSRPFYISGTRITYFCPFEGDASLFRNRPSTFDFSPPRGTISGQDLILSYQTADHDAERVKAQFDYDLAHIRQYLGWQAQQVASYNASVHETVRTTIIGRREKLLRDRDMVMSLGFPVRRREGAPQTYTVPTVRRRVSVARPATKRRTDSSPIDPTLDARTYDDVLGIMHNMVQVMERSPHAFRTMREEDIRHHFLVQLNGQFEGQATGETFNAEGKTDILIRVEGKNIFIAECKFWKGEKAFAEAVEQLFGYTTWRDTKSAILIFNRTKSLTGVLKAIPAAVKAHPQFKREILAKTETEFRYVFGHKDDPEREMLVAVLVFEIPS
jgi:hypothetical protein